MALFPFTQIRQGECHHSWSVSPTRRLNMTLCWYGNPRALLYSKSRRTSFMNGLRQWPHINPKLMDEVSAYKQAHIDPKVMVEPIK